MVSPNGSLSFSKIVASIHVSDHLSLDDITPHTVSDGSFYVSYGEIPDPVFIDDLAPTVRYLDSHNRFVS